MESHFMILFLKKREKEKMTNSESTRFNELYCLLTESEKTMMKNVTIKLLKVNFLLRRTNKEMYSFIMNHKELLSLFFEYMNFDFNIREDKELVYIKSNDDTLISNITKNETLALLVLRLIYQKKMDEVSLADEVETTIAELQNQLFSFNFDSQNNDRVKRSTLREMLQIFKQHNIIYYKDDLALDDTVITIYPSIEVAMDFKEINEILTRIELLKGGDDIDD